MGRRSRFDILEQRALGLDVLEDRFDDHVGVRDAVAAHVGNQPVERIADPPRILETLGKPESLIKRVADRQGHDRRYSLDTTKLERLGFKCDTDFDKALHRTVQWYVENEPWWRAIKERSAEFKAYYDKQYGARV